MKTAHRYNSFFLNYAVNSTVGWPIKKHAAAGSARLLWYGDIKRAGEGPHILQKDGRYYIILAEGDTGSMVGLYAVGTDFTAKFVETAIQNKKAAQTL